MFLAVIEWDWFVIRVLPPLLCGDHHLFHLLKDILSPAPDPPLAHATRLEHFEAMLPWNVKAELIASR